MKDSYQSLYEEMSKQLSTLGWDNYPSISDIADVKHEKKTEQRSKEG